MRKTTPIDLQIAFWKAIEDSLQSKEYDEVIIAKEDDDICPWEIEDVALDNTL